VEYRFYCRRAQRLRARFVDAARMENAGRQFLFIKGRGKAKHVCVENRFAPMPCRKDRG